MRQQTVAQTEKKSATPLASGISQRATVPPVSKHTVPPVVQEVLRSPGRPLDAGTRVLMESRFGYDFSRVRVHTDAKAAESAQTINALAYTAGRNIVFAPGQYVPHQASGRNLIAHELTHVVQQSGIQPRLPTYESNAYELEAEAVSDMVGQGRPAVPILGQTATKSQNTVPTGKPVMLIQRNKGTGEEPTYAGLAPETHTIILNVLLALNPLLTPIVATMNALGFEVSGLGIGLRAAGSVNIGVGAGVGTDVVFLVDMRRMQLTGDVVTFGEVGIGIEEGVSVGVVVAFRISPRGASGDPKASYAGTTLNASIEYLVGLGCSVSSDIFRGREGWVSALISIGEQLGTEVSVSHGVSLTLQAEEVGGEIEEFFDELFGGLATLVEVGSLVPRLLGAVSTGLIEHLVFAAYATVDPHNWDLSRLPKSTQGDIYALGFYLWSKVDRDDPDSVLKLAARPLSEFPIPRGLMRHIAAGLTQSLPSQEFTPEYLLGLSPLQFIHRLADWKLLSFKQDPDVLADRLRWSSTRRAEASRAE